MKYQFVARETCPACGSSDLRVVHSSRFSEGGIAAFLRNWYSIDPSVLDAAPYELERCGNCALIFQHFIGDPQLMRDLYTDWQYKKWNWHPGQPELQDPELGPVYREHLEEMPLSLFAHELMVASSFLKVPLSRMKTLDYGMGWGLWVRIAQKLGCDSYGLEVSEEHLQYIRRHGCGGITDAEIPEHRFHFINTEQVFEHVAQPLQLLKLLAGSLVPGGVVKISVPSGEKADRILAMLNEGSFGGDYETIMPVHPLEHINTYTRGTIRKMADITGLKLAKPNLIQSYAFLGRKGTVSLRRPKKSAKELVRPIYQWIQPSNIYLWLRKC